MKLLKNCCIALLAMNICVPYMYSMDTEQSDLVERVQLVTINNQSSQLVCVWQKIDWNFIHEQQEPQPTREIDSISSMVYKAITWLLLPSMPKPKKDWVSTGGMEIEMGRLSPGESQNFSIMLCTKIGDGHYKKRTEAFINLRRPQPSGPIWGPVICSCTLNTDQTVSYVVTENAEQELMMRRQK